MKCILLLAGYSEATDRWIGFLFVVVVLVVKCFLTSSHEFNFRREMRHLAFRMRETSAYRYDKWRNRTSSSLLLIQYTFNLLTRRQFVCSRSTLEGFQHLRRYTPGRKTKSIHGEECKKLYKGYRCC
jgi:hypothetical protein